MRKSTTSSDTSVPTPLPATSTTRQALTLKSPINYLIEVHRDGDHVEARHSESGLWVTDNTTERAVARLQGLLEQFLTSPEAKH